MNFERLFSNCSVPTEDNPYNNYLSNTNTSKKNKACEADDKEIENRFYDKTNFSPAPVKISDGFRRNFYTNPVTTAVNNQSEFANFLFGNTSTCRDTGYSCKIKTDNVGVDRTIIETDFYKPNYLNVSELYNNK